MKNQPLPLAHVWSESNLLEAIVQEPLPCLQWEAARTTLLSPALALALKDALVRARFALVPPSKMHVNAVKDREFADIVAVARYGSGTSFLRSLSPQSFPNRSSLPFSYPALCVALPFRAEDPLQVRPGFLRKLDADYFWDGQRFVLLSDPKLSVFTYWKMA